MRCTKMIVHESLALASPNALFRYVFDIFQTSSIFVILNLLFIFFGINFISKIAKINDEDRKGIIAEGTLQNLPVAAAVASLLEINIITLVALNYFLISSTVIGIYAIYKSRDY